MALVFIYVYHIYFILLTVKSLYVYSHLDKLREENGRKKSPAFCFTLCFGCSVVGQAQDWDSASTDSSSPNVGLMTMDACKTCHNFSCRTYDLLLNPRHTFLSLWARDFKWATKLPLMWSAQSQAWEIFALKVTARLSLWTIYLSRRLTLVASKISIPYRDFHIFLGPAVSCMNKATSPSACLEVNAI